jgi:pantothenate kinase
VANSSTDPEAHRATERTRAQPSAPVEATRVTIDDLARRVRQLAASRDRVLVAIVGEPGAGKSTLAELLAVALHDLQATLVPLDGFHLANEVLRMHGTLHRKGSPETFDLAGYRALVERIRDAHESVYAPRYERSIEEAIAGAITVAPTTRVVLTEGNYLLLDQPDMVAARRAFDEVWYLDTPATHRLSDLVARHMRFGKSRSEAEQWAFGSDQANADLVRAARAGADLVVQLVRGDDATLA